MCQTMKLNGHMWVLGGLLALAGACGGGSDDGGGSNAADKFVGTWTYQSGAKLKLTCGTTMLDNDLTGDVTVSKNDAGELVAKAGDKCSLTLTLSGTMANLKGASQPCNLMMVDTTVTMFNITSADGQSGTTAFTANGTLPFGMCEVKGTGGLVKKM